MLNETISALKTKLLTVPVAKVLESEHRIAMVSKNDYLQVKFSPTDFPLILLDFIKGDMKIAGLQPGVNNLTVYYGYSFPGNIIVVGRGSSIKDVRESVNNLVFGNAGVYKTLLPPPSISVGGVSVKMKLGQAYTQALNMDLTEVAYIAVIIPCEIEFNL